MISKNTLLSERYRIIRSIGEGGMADVYLAEDMILERQVALKVLRGDLSEDDTFIRRFKREALAATSLNHPNIVQIYDIGEDGDTYFIVMEYISGNNLKQLLSKRKHLTLSEVIDICKQLALALSHAHSKTIVHRDIKPHNVIIQEDGTVKITDFGIAVTMNATILTQTNSVMGSVHYLAPEQIGGDVVDLRSDIYSFGIVMYELITGQVPFNSDTPVTIALKHVNDDFPSIIEKDATVPQSVENIIFKCCAKNPENRYQDAMELFNDLQRCLDVEDAEKIVIDEVKEDTAKKYLINGKKSSTVVGPNKINRKKRYLIMSAIIVPFLIAVLIAVFLLANREVVIPDVSNMEISKAIDKLEDVGLKVSDEYVEVYNENIAEGLVVNTQPRIGKKTTKDIKIILEVSIGKEYIIVKNYLGKDAVEVQKELESEGVIAKIVTKGVSTPPEEGKENLIVEQSIKEGEQLKIGEEIILYTPVLEATYPNFVGDKSTTETIQSFCNTYKISCLIREEYNDEIPAGQVISQSTKAGQKLNVGDSLTVVVSRGPDPNSDKDKDGLTYREEIELGTDPNVFDTDGDGDGDGLEVSNGTDPLDKESHSRTLSFFR